MEKRYDVVTLTFHQSENYGALLQAYALQKAIRNLGYKTCIIDYYSTGIAYWSRKINFLKDGYNLSTVKNIIWQYIIRKKTEKFNVFRKELQLSGRFEGETIQDSEALSKCFIVGSDQVWNCDCTFEDYHYFLDFLGDNHRKLSYAASFGYSEIPPKYLERTKALLEAFDVITTREEQGQSIVKELIDKDAITVLDPVLLITPEQWDFGGIGLGKKYIFVYQAEKSNSLIEYAKHIGYKLKCPIYIVSNVFKGTIGKNIHSISDIGPDQFINYLKGAEYVVTNSFHGTALSILFNKHFSVELLKKNNTNSRIISILQKYGLENRIIGADMGHRGKAIDYSEINRMLAKDREKSLNILSDMISDNIEGEN